MNIVIPIGDADKPLLRRVGMALARCLIRRFMIGSLVMAVGGCGQTSKSPVSQGPDRSLALRDTPVSVMRQCASLTRDHSIKVLCPTDLPDGRWRTAHRSMIAGRCAYLLDLNSRPFGSGAMFHVLAGGQCGRLSLKTRGGRWPARELRPADLDRYLRLLGGLPLKPGQPPSTETIVKPRVVRRADVHGHNALVLEVSAYPAGGLHGGHIGVVWNQGGAGYALTLHFSAAPAVSRRVSIATALNMAELASRAR